MVRFLFNLFFVLLLYKFETVELSQLFSLIADKIILIQQKNLKI